MTAAVSVVTATAAAAVAMHGACLALVASAAAAPAQCASPRDGTPKLCNATANARSAAYYALAPTLPTLAAWHGNDAAQVYLPFMAGRDASAAYGGTSCPEDGSRRWGGDFFTWPSPKLNIPLLSGFHVATASQVATPFTVPAACPRVAPCAIDGVEAAEFEHSELNMGFLTAPSTLARLANAGGEARTACNVVPVTKRMQHDWALLTALVDDVALAGPGGIMLNGVLVSNSSKAQCLCPSDVAESTTSTCAACPSSGIRVPHALWKLYVHRDGNSWRTWTFIADQSTTQTPLAMLRADHLARVQREMGIHFPQAFHDGAQSVWLDASDIVNPPEVMLPPPREATAAMTTQAPTQLPLPPWVKASFFRAFETTTAAPVTHAPCSGGRYWSECGASCTPTCGEMTPVCTSQCVARCECPLGSMWHQGQCIPPTQCPKPGCANGNYRYTSPVTGFHYCLGCPPGKYGRAVRGEGFCQLCRPGRFQDRYGAHDEISSGGAAKSAGGALADEDDDGTPCKTCPVGHFANAFGTGCNVEAAPLQCGVGTYLALSRHTQRAHCFDCPAGKHGVLVDGEATCFFCGSGMFQPVAKQSDCLPCPAGTRSAPYRASCTRTNPAAELSPGTICPSGSFLLRNASPTGQDVCTACPAGKHRDAASMPDVGCLLCAAGFHQPRSGSAGCIACPVGTYSSSYRTFCADSLPEPDAPCPIGTYKHESALIRKVGCFACPSGKFGFVLNAVDSAHQHVQFAVCKACEPGKHQPKEGSTACVTCPVGQHSTFFRAQCTSGSPRLCPIGKFRTLERDGGAGNVESLGWAGARKDGVDDSAADDEGRCVNCPAGKYGDTTAGEGECYYCSPNFHQRLVGQTKCERCAAGKAATIFRTACTAPASALPCPSGHYKFISTVLHEVECVKCPTGKYGHQLACHTCPAGKYQNEAARTSCIECPADRSDAIFHRFCMTPSIVSEPAACVAGRFMFTSAVTKTSHCYTCPLGKFSPRASGECVEACPAGTSVVSGSRKCKPCAAGQYQTAVGQPSCQACRAGKHVSHVTQGAITEDAACSDCNVGKYQDQSMQPTCIACPAGYSSSRYRKYCTAEGSFVVCPAGKYHSKSDLDPAAADGFAASECIDCPATTVSPPGASKCVGVCPAGTQNAPPTTQRCQSCTPGRYRSLAATGLASEFCRACPDGQFQPDYGSHLCVPCPAGAIVVPGSNRTRCEAVTAKPTSAPTTARPTPRCVDASVAQCSKPPQGCTFMLDAGVQRVNDAAVAEGHCKPYPCGLRKCGDECKHDISPPVLFLHGPATFASNRSLESIEKLVRFERPFEGYSCVDICDGDITSSAVTSEWRFGGCDGERHAFDPRTPGTWGLVYRCRDSTGLSATACRVITHTQSKLGPQIQLNGPLSITLRAQKGKRYTVFGAKCYDSSGSDLPMTTEIFAPDGTHVSIGLHIDQGTLGLFRVVYRCRDAQGKEAEKVRLVFVKDQTCPLCNLVRGGKWGERVEAHVPFNPLDDVVCTDDMAAHVLPTVSGRVNLDVPGAYVITYHARDAAGNMNDGLKCGHRTVAYSRTIVVTTAIAKLHLKLSGQVGTHRCQRGMELRASEGSSDESCIMCSAGMFQPTPMAACRLCSAGKYQPWAGRTRCVACRSNEVASADRRECVSTVPIIPRWESLPSASANVADLWLPCSIPELPPPTSGSFSLDSLPPAAPGAAPQKRLRVRCHADFKLVGSAERVCEARSSGLGGGWAWSGSQSVCIPDKCAASTNPPAVPLHGQVVRQTMGKGQDTRVEAWYACDSGYGLQRSGGQKLICDGLEPCIAKHTCDPATGAWNGTRVRCMKDCGAPPVPSANMEGSPRVRVGAATIDGESAYYYCANPAFAFVGDAFARARGVGSTVPGEVRLTCGHDGEWHEEVSGLAVVGRLPGSCEVVNCGAPPDIVDGSVISQGTGFGATAEYSCDSGTGHELVGSATSRCEIDGTWHGVPTCATVRYSFCCSVSCLSLGRSALRTDIWPLALLAFLPSFLPFTYSCCPQVQLCSHVRCKLARDPLNPSRNAVSVLHHGSEQHGNTHTCRYMSQQEQCACLCYDTDRRWRAAANERAALHLTASSAAIRR